MQSVAYPNHSTALTELYTTRVFNFPVEMVFKYILQKRLFQQWWAPIGYKNEVHKFDIREGGTMQFTIYRIDGYSILNTCTILELLPGSFICWEQSTQDDILVSIQFDSYPFNKTKVSLKMKSFNIEYNEQIKEQRMVHNEEILDKLKDLLERSNA